MKTLRVIVLLGIILGVIAPGPGVAAPNQLLTDALVGYWPLDEVNSTDVRHSMVPVTMPWMDATYTGYGPEDAPGLIGNGIVDAHGGIPSAFSYVSAGEYMQTTMFADEWTMTGWFYGHGTPDPGYGEFYPILWANNSWDLIVYNGGFTFENAAGTSYIRAENTYQEGQWHHFAIWQIGEGTNIYSLNIQIDNGDVYTTHGAPPMATVQTGMSLGGSWTANLMDGVIDEVGFWSRTLSQSERTKIYNNGAGCAYPFTNCENPCPNQMYTLFDATTDGTLVSGSPDGVQARIDNYTKYVIDATYQVATPNLMIGLKPGNLQVTFNDPGNLRALHGPATITATINGYTATIGEGPIEINDTAIPIMGPNDTSTITIHAEVPGTPNAGGDTISINTVAMRALVYSCAYNSLLDGGMEQYPGSMHWDPYGSDTFFGRLNSLYDTGYMNLLNGDASCGTGSQRVGKVWTDGALLPSDGAPVEQQITWPGGTLYWKARTKALGYSPYIYFADTAGSVIVTLIGGPSTDTSLQSTAWSLRSGSVDLEAGVYNLRLDRSNQNNLTLAPYVQYDDVAISSTGVNLEWCDDTIEEPPPDIPTPTPTNTGQPSPTATQQGTLIPSRTVTATAPSTQTRTITPTARATRTATVTPDGWEPSITPGGATVTSTQVSTSTPYGPSQPGTSTAGPTPTGTLTPGFGDGGEWDGGNMPPGSGEGGNNPAMGDCNRPANAWSIVAWVDYEFCRLFYAVSWQPQHSATLAAWPTRYANYEPMASSQRWSDEVNVISTEASSYSWAGPNIGTGGDPEAFQPGPSSPWNGGSISLTEAPDTTYQAWCSASLEDVVGSGVMQGVCFVINLLRAKQLLWIFQAVINVCSVIIASSSIYNIIKIRLRYQ